MIGFVLGAAAGYVLGARAGRARYEQIARGAQRLWHSDPVQHRLERTGHAVKTQAVPYVADRVSDAVKAAGQGVKRKAEAIPVLVHRGPDTWADAVPTGPAVPPQDGGGVETPEGHPS